MRTAQVIAPGYACPSNHFLVSAIEAVDDDLLYITSANRSRHLTGADDTPAHWRAEGLRAEFGHVPSFEVLEHPDEAAARVRYLGYLPTSTTLLGFHKLGDEPGDDRPQLVLERHGSMAADDVRAVLDSLGFGMVVSPNVQRRLLLRDYPAFGPAFEVDYPSVFAGSAKYLAAAIEAAGDRKVSPDDLAKSKPRLDEMKKAAKAVKA